MSNTFESELPRGQALSNWFSSNGFRMKRDNRLQRRGRSQVLTGFPLTHHGIVTGNQHTLRSIPGRCQLASVEAYRLREFEGFLDLW